MKKRIKSVLSVLLTASLAAGCMLPVYAADDEYVSWEDEYDGASYTEDEEDYELYDEYEIGDDAAYAGDETEDPDDAYGADDDEYADGADYVNDETEYPDDALYEEASEDEEVLLAKSTLVRYLQE